MTKLWASLAGAFFLLSAVWPATATVVIADSPGGGMDEFMERYEAIRASGDHIRVEGRCASACTMMLGIIPSSRICVTPQAWFGFHSAQLVNLKTLEAVFSEDGTRELWAMYPAKVRAMLRARGWDGKSEHTDLIRIEGYKLYRPCHVVINGIFDPYDPNAPIEQPAVEPRHNQQHEHKPVVEHTVPAKARRVKHVEKPVVEEVVKPVVVQPVVEEVVQPPTVGEPKTTPRHWFSRPLETLGAGLVIGIALALVGWFGVNFYRGFMSARKGA